MSRAVLPADRGAYTASRLIIPMIIRTIRLDPSGPDQIDEAPNVSRPDPSGADQGGVRSLV